MTTTTSLYETCQNLYASYPLAVGNHDNMVLAVTGGSEPAFYGLGRSASGFDVWHLDGPAFARITPDTGPAAEVADILAKGLPLPRHGSFFGWNADGMVTATMTVHVEYSPKTPVPGWAVAPLEGVQDSSWPPFTSMTLAESSFWDYYRNGDIVDLGPLVAATPGAIFWAHPGSLTYACCAVARDITSPAGWVFPQGAYVWWQSLQNGETAGPLDELLAGDLTDLSPRFRTEA